jgi:hypothetical protein
MQKFKRPVICTEYMARQTGSKFITHLPLFKEKKVWAINWGFVLEEHKHIIPGGQKKEILFHKFGSMMLSIPMAHHLIKQKQISLKDNFSMI